MQHRTDAITRMDATLPRIARVAVLAAIMCAVTGAPSIAYAKTMQEKMQDACADDIARLCPTAAADPDQLKGCMLKHRAEASRACMRLIDASE